MKKLIEIFETTWMQLIIYFIGVPVLMFGALYLQDRGKLDDEIALPKFSTLVFVANYDASCSIDGQSVQSLHRTSGSFGFFKRFDVGDPVRRSIYEKNQSKNFSIYFGKNEKILHEGVLKLPILASPHSCYLLEDIEFSATQAYTNVKSKCEFIGFEPLFSASCKIEIKSLSDCYNTKNDVWGCSQTTLEERQKKRVDDEALWVAYQALHSSKD